MFGTDSGKRGSGSGTSTGAAGTGVGTDEAETSIAGIGAVRLPRCNMGGHR